MATHRPSIVLFDLGNVLVHIHPEAFLQVLGIDTPDNRRYYQPFVNSIVREYERGAESTEEFLVRLDRLFNARDGEGPRRGTREIFSPDEFRRAMLAVIGRPVAGMEKLVCRVAKLIPVGLLSNTNRLHYDSCIENLPSLRSIPTHFLSYELKSLKPSQAIFRQVTEILKLTPSDILYVDDMPENIDGARSIGWDCHLFNGCERLEQLLDLM